MLLEGDIIVIVARSIDFDESYMLVEEEVTKDTLEYGDTFIETKVDFLLTYFKKVVIIINCEHSYIITCNGERWLSLAIFFYVKT